MVFFFFFFPFLLAFFFLEEPGMPAFERFINFIKLPVVVPVEQLRPDTEYAERIVSATSDIRLCEDLFNKWSTRLNRCVQQLYVPQPYCHYYHGNHLKRLVWFCSISSETPDERERKVRHHLAWLREATSGCSEATKEILRCHAHFADMMARRIDDASKSWFKGLGCDPDSARLAKDITRASRSLSESVMRLQTDLASFVSDLEKMDVKEKKLIVRQMLGWLKILLNALSKIFALGSFIAPFLQSVASGMGLVLPVGSILCKAAAELCGIAAGTFL